MGSQEIAHDTGYYIGLGIQTLAVVVVFGLVIVGIVIAVRAKTTTGRGCGIVMAIALALQFCLVALWLIINIFAGLPSAPASGSSKMQVVQASE